jgi:uncharacterized HAD superfamily protein
MKIYESIINHKMNTITTEELLKYANQYQISLSKQHAAQIAEILRGKKINIFHDQERAHLMKEIAKIAGINTAKEVNRLFVSFTK